MRSVMARYLLNYKYGFDALAMGWEPNSEATKTMLYEWADVIIPMQPEFLEKIPEAYRAKATVVFDVGPDRWGLNGDLMNTVDALLQQALAPEEADNGH